MSEDIILNKPLGPKEPNKIIARKLLDYVASGDSMITAAEKMGLSWDTLNSAPLQTQFAELLKTARFSADVQREVVRAARMKMLGHAMSTGMEPWKDDKGVTHPGDSGMLKIAAEMTKQIASDPQVGLTAPPQTTINLQFTGTARELLDQTEPLPGFENVEFLDGTDEVDGKESPVVAKVDPPDSTGSIDIEGRGDVAGAELPEGEGRDLEDDGA